jgi:hypothetical protein
MKLEQLKKMIREVAKKEMLKEEEINWKAVQNTQKSLKLESASRTAMEIGGLTGLNKDAVQKFVDTHNLDIEKVFQFVKKGNLSDRMDFRMDFVNAVSGKPNNPIQKKLIKKLQESVNEGKKRFKQQDGIGSSKYTISFHDGKKKHKDGSDFFDIKIFKNKQDLEAFKKELLSNKYVSESVNEAANSKGYKPKNDFGARIIQAIDTNIKEANPKYLKKDGVDNAKILEYGKSFFDVVRNGIKAAFKFNYKIHPDVEFPMRRPKGNYFWFDSKEDMEKYLKKFLSDLKKLDAMIVNYQKKPTLKVQQEICDFWNFEVMVGSSQTGAMGPGIARSDRSGQSMYESVNEDTKKRFDVDFYKSNGDRETSHEEIIRGDKFSDVISQATKDAKSKGMNYVEFYHRNLFIGSIDKKSNYTFKKGRDSQKSPLSVNEAKKYDIGSGYLGNGLTIWNRAEEKDGDYETIAHIGKDGKLTIYDKEIPTDIKKMIGIWATSMKKGNRPGSY